MRLPKNRGIKNTSPRSSMVFSYGIISVIPRHYLKRAPKFHHTYAHPDTHIHTRKIKINIETEELEPPKKAKIIPAKGDTLDSVRRWFEAGMVK